MAIQINPNRINTAAGGAGNATTQRHQGESQSARVVVPSRAEINNIPAPETLSTMIRSAVAALQKGVFCDRGTIVNPMV